MRRVSNQKPKKKNGSGRCRPYHLADDEPHTFESGENPDWLVGAN